MSAAGHESYPDDVIRGVLRSVKTIAMAGASNNPARPSFLVLQFLLGRGYNVIPVNPGLAGKTIHGALVRAALADVPGPIDMVDIFRNSDAAGEIVDEALRLDPLPKVIWMQLGVRNDAAAARAEAKGLRVIMNRCPKIEHGRLSGESRWSGINSGVVSAKKPTLFGGGFQKLGIGG